MSSNTAAKTPAKHYHETRMMVQIAMLTAVAEVLMLFDFPLPFAPSFYKIDLSEVPILIGCFAMGPAAGIIIEAMKILLNFIISGTVTAGVGELANFAIGCSMVLPAGLIYRYHKTRKNAVLGMAAGTPGYGSHRRPFKCFRSSSRLCGSLRRNGCHHRNGNCRQ